MSQPPEECRTGIVESSSGGRAKVRVRKTRCDTCSIAASCLAAMGGGEDLIEVLDPKGTRPGAKVELGIPASVEIKIACTLYLLPAIWLILGVALGQEVSRWLEWNAVLTSMILGLILTALSLWPARRVARRLKHTPAILRTVQED